MRNVGGSATEQQRERKKSAVDKLKSTCSVRDKRNEGIQERQREEDREKKRTKEKFFCAFLPKQSFSTATETVLGR